MSERPAETINVDLTRDTVAELTKRIGQRIVQVEGARNDGQYCKLSFDPMKQRLNEDQQERVVRVALDCKVTGDWKLFERIADEILLSSLGFPEGSPRPGVVDHSGPVEGQNYSDETLRQCEQGIV